MKALSHTYLAQNDGLKYHSINNGSNPPEPLIKLSEVTYLIQVWVGKRRVTESPLLVQQITPGNTYLIE